MMFFSQDDIINFEFRQTENSINIHSRTIFFEDAIEIFTPSTIKEKVHLITSLSNNDKSPITLELSSFGGDVYGALGTIDTIQNISTPINVLGRGAIMSAAVLILSCTTGERAITKNCVVMIHELSTLLAGTSKDIVTEAKHIEKLQMKLFQILAENSKKPVEFWRKETKTNLYLSVEECLEYGLIDKIM